MSRPSSTSEIDTAWQGNLPCVVGSKSGCAFHNPNHLTIFFQPRLVATPKSEIIKGIFSKKTEGSTDESLQVQRAEEIWNDMELEDMAVCEPLPAIHSSVHYNLAHYHLNSIKKQVASLSSLRCQGQAGSYPSVQFDINPQIIRGTFVLRYDFSFTQRWKNAPGPGKIYAHEVTPLLFDGFSFSICPHMTQRFTSTTWHYQKNIHTVAIKYKMKNALKQNIPGTWNNVVNQQPVLMSCCYCFTEFRVKFQLKTVGDNPPEVDVLVRVYKDLGGGEYLSDPKWISGFRGCSSKIRETTDFGRIEKWVEKQEARSSI